jgi:hypothetical protein
MVWIAGVLTTSQVLIVPKQNGLLFAGVLTT